MTTKTHDKRVTVLVRESLEETGSDAPYSAILGLVRKHMTDNPAKRTSEERALDVLKKIETGEYTLRPRVEPAEIERLRGEGENLAPRSTHLLRYVEAKHTGISHVLAVACPKYAAAVGDHCRREKGISR